MSIETQPNKEFAHLTDAELLGLWARLMKELRDRGVIRSENHPTGDVCERLVAAHYGVELERKSKAGYDLVTRDKVRVQVKGRRFTSRSRPAHFAGIRKLDAHDFDIVVGVVLDEDFSVRGAWTMTWEAVKRHARKSEHINAWNMPLVNGVPPQDRGIAPLDLTVAL